MAKEKKQKNPFVILRASKEEVEGAFSVRAFRDEYRDIYRALVAMYHSDIDKSGEAAAQFADLTWAWEELEDESAFKDWRKRFLAHCSSRKEAKLEAEVAEATHDRRWLGEQLEDWCLASTRQFEKWRELCDRRQVNQGKYPELESQFKKLLQLSDRALQTHRQSPIERAEFMVRESTTTEWWWRLPIVSAFKPIPSRLLVCDSPVKISRTENRSDKRPTMVEESLTGFDLEMDARGRLTKFPLEMVAYDHFSETPDVFLEWTIHTLRGAGASALANIPVKSLYRRRPAGAQGKRIPGKVIGSLSLFAIQAETLGYRRVQHLDYRKEIVEREVTERVEVSFTGYDWEKFRPLAVGMFPLIASGGIFGGGRYYTLVISEKVQGELRFSALGRILAMHRYGIDDPRTVAQLKDKEREGT